LLNTSDFQGFNSKNNKINIIYEKLIPVKNKTRSIKEIENKE
jgi:hypothetical protein